MKITPMVDPATRDWIKAESKRLQISQGQVIDELVEKGHIQAPGKN